MRALWDPAVVVWLEGDHVRTGSPEEARAAGLGRAGDAVALTEVTLWEGLGSAEELEQQLEIGAAESVTLIDPVSPVLAQAFVAPRARLTALGGGQGGIPVTAYPVALRRGVEATRQRPEAGWVFVDPAAGVVTWLTVWDGAQLLQFRRLDPGQDLAAELARSLHALRTTRPEHAVSGFATEDSAVEVLTAEGVLARRWPGVSPALAGLAALPAEARFWLPETLEEAAEARRRARLRRARFVAATLFVVGLAVGVGGEWSYRDASGRLTRALAEQEAFSEARQRAIQERAGTLAREWTRQGLTLLQLALTTTPSDGSAALTAAFERRQWQTKLESLSAATARAFAARVPGSAVRPALVGQGLGWTAQAQLQAPAWTDWPSR